MFGLNCLKNVGFNGNNGWQRDTSVPVKPKKKKKKKSQGMAFCK